VWRGRTAATITAADQEAVQKRLGALRVLIELEALDADAETTLLAAVRQAVLMWTDVTVSIPIDRADLAARCREVGHELRPGQAGLRFDARASHAEYEGVLHIGPTAFADPKVVSVTHSGWVVHIFAAPTSALRPFV